MLSYRPNVHLLTDPWAEHPVVNRHICSGDMMGGGGGGADLPKYDDYIQKVTAAGDEGMGWARELYGWAKNLGVDLNEVATRLSGKAEAAGDLQQARSERLMADWERRSKPLLDAKAAEAERMNRDAPAYEEHAAGKAAADTANALDQEKAAVQRKMLAEGTTAGRPGIASQALDTMASAGRALATTAAGEGGRQFAKQERRAVASDALGQDQFTAGVGGQQGTAAAGNRGAATGMRNAAAQTAANLYAPATSMYGNALGAYSQWGHALDSQTQAALKQNEEEEGGGMGDIMGLVGGVGGTVAGAYFGGPGGAMAGGSAGSSLGGQLGRAMGAKGGKIPPIGRRVPRGYAGGGAIDTSLPGADNMVTPDMSPSGGEEVDDVPAMVSEGEFVIPERTVDWYGEQYFQKLIMKADKEREQQTVAAPEEGPPPEQGQQAMDTSAPMFRSEGARV